MSSIDYPWPPPLHMLGLTCQKCGRVVRYTGATQTDVEQIARRAGWRWNKNITQRYTTLCPDCAKAEAGQHGRRA